MATGSETGLSLNSRAVSKRIVRTIANSLSVKIVLLGVIFVVAGYLRQTGPLAAMLAIWGAALMAGGIGSYLAVWKTRY